MNKKQIELIVNPPQPHFVGNGFRVHGFIPGVPQLSQARMDPFLILDYNGKYDFPPSEEPKGVGVHPHKGFETVTIAYKGSVAHEDSSGGGGVINEGDVQWMTAGSGILHKEFHEEEFNKAGGTFQMVQLWVNLPAKFKTEAPRYQALLAEEIPNHLIGDGNGRIEVIAGNYKGTQGSAETFTPLNMFNAHLRPKGQASFSFPENFTTTILIVEGSVLVNGETPVATDHLVLFENKGEEFTLQAQDEGAVVLVLSGEPINEPIVSYGPFVMNTKEEVVQAFEDFNAGKFGYLE